MNIALMFIIVGVVISLTILINNGNTEDYKKNNTVCFRCKRNNNLIKVPILIQNKQTIGYVFTCKECLKFLEDKDVYHIISDKKHEQQTN